MFTVQVRFDREQRRELVGYLSGEGMSQRAIADVVGVGVGTVNRDLDAGVPNGTPQPDLDDPVVDKLIAQGLVESAEEYRDCLAMADLPEDQFEEVLVEAREQDDLSRENVARLARDRTVEQEPITGRDGKTYKRKQRRQPPPEPEHTDEDEDTPPRPLATIAGVLSVIVDYCARVDGFDPADFDAEDVQYASAIFDSMDAIRGYVAQPPGDRYIDDLMAVFAQAFAPHRLEQFDSSARRHVIDTMKETIQKLEELEGDPVLHRPPTSAARH